MKAHEILNAAAGHLADRAKTYDKPEGERSMAATVEAFKAVTGHELTETQGWLFMALLKAVRSQQNAFKLDSYEDGAAYFALAGESAAKGAAPGGDNDGWIEWHGGECPVDPDMVAEIRFVDGYIATFHVNHLSWQHNGTARDIIAYRVIK